MILYLLIHNSIHSPVLPSFYHPYVLQSIAHEFIFLSLYITHTLDGQRTIIMGPSFFRGYRKTCLKPNEILVSILIPFTEEVRHLDLFIDPLLIIFPSVHLSVCLCVFKPHMNYSVVMRCPMEPSATSDISHICHIVNCCMRLDLWLVT